MSIQGKNEGLTIESKTFRKLDPLSNLSVFISDFLIVSIQSFFPNLSNSPQSVQHVLHFIYKDSTPMMEHDMTQREITC